MPPGLTGCCDLGGLFIRLFKKAKRVNNVPFGVTEQSMRPRRSRGLKGTAERSVEWRGSHHSTLELRSESSVPTPYKKRPAGAGQFMDASRETEKTIRPSNPEPRASFHPPLKT
jgi:hypothetical protein